MTNSTTGIGTVKLLSGTKCSYRLIVAVTEIVTKSTTGICTVKLLSGTKCTIITTGKENLYGGVEVWLLSLTYAPVKGLYLNARSDRSLRFQRRTLSFSWQLSLLYFLSVMCYINRQTQHYRCNILILFFNTVPPFCCPHKPSVSPNKKLLRNTDSNYCGKMH